MPTYRSKVPITTAARRSAVYEAIIDVMQHLLSPRWSDVNVTRIQLMADNYVQVDTNVVIPAAHVDHLGLTGPI